MGDAATGRGFRDVLPGGSWLLPRALLGPRLTHEMLPSREIRRKEREGSRARIHDTSRPCGADSQAAASDLVAPAVLPPVRSPAARPPALPRTYFSKSSARMMA